MYAHNSVPYKNVYFYNQIYKMRKKEKKGKKEKERKIKQP